jgi:UPF0755 protein
MNYLKRAAIILPIFLVTLALFFYFGFSKPNSFSSAKYVYIEKGTSLLKIGEELKKEGIIRSKTVFVVLEKIASAEKSVKAGDYFFKEPASVFDVVVRLFKGDFGIEQKKIIVHEGETYIEIAENMEGFINFDKKKFLEIAKTQEGYLFPDTYFLYVNVSAEELVEKLKNNFDEKIKPLDSEIKNNSESFSDIIIMASIIEKEVADPVDRLVVSGILWKRIDKGMPLQVDAAPDTYKYKGLPPAPICNPGLDTIEAALNPKASPYYFYLTGKDGKTYFAKTFDEHKKNKEKYLH